MHEVHDTIIGLNINKATVGTPRRCIKLASAYISGPLPKIFNQSLLQGVVPDISNISKFTPADKGGDTTGNPKTRNPESGIIGHCFTNTERKNYPKHS